MLLTVILKQSVIVNRLYVTGDNWMFSVCCGGRMKRRTGQHARMTGEPHSPSESRDSSRLENLFVLILSGVF